MSLILPDPRLEAPELLYPGRKPAGNVVIDWAHQAAKGNFLALLFNASNIQEIPNSRQLFQWTNTGGSTPVVGKGGTSFQPASTNDQNTNALTLTGQDWSAILHGSNDVTPYSIAFQFSTNDATPTDQQGIWHLGRPNGTGGQYVYVDENSTLVAASGNFQNKALTKSITENALYTVVVTIDHDGANFLTGLWVDGESIGSDIWGSVDQTRDDAVEIGRLFTSNTYGDCLNGNIYSFFAWDYVLPDTLAKSLSRDLYQFLVPQ